MVSISETWNEICFLLSTGVKAGFNEKDFENQVVRVIEILGWKEYKNEIERQHSIQVGRYGSLIPDLIVNSSERKAIIAVEVKRPTEDISKDNSISQLKSYMRQLKSDFGFLVGNELRIYYDGIHNPQPDPLLLEKISYDSDSQDGKDFVAHFNKDNFNNPKFSQYINNNIHKFNKKAEVDKLVELLIKPETKEKFLAFLKTEYPDFSEDVHTTAFNHISLNISKISDFKPETNLIAKKVTKPRNFSKVHLAGQNFYEIPKEIGEPNIYQLSLRFTNRAKQSLLQIYAVLYFMKKGFDFPASVKFSLKFFPDARDYPTLADKCGRRFAGSIPQFVEWFESNDILNNLARKYSLSDYEYQSFKDLLGG